MAICFFRKDSPVSAEAGVSRNYVDWLLAVPWKKASREIRDIARAEKVLHEDHYGLEEIKTRLVESASKIPEEFARPSSCGIPGAIDPSATGPTS